MLFIIISIIVLFSCCCFCCCLMTCFIVCCVFPKIDGAYFEVIRIIVLLTTFPLFFFIDIIFFAYYLYYQQTHLREETLYLKKNPRKVYVKGKIQTCDEIIPMRFVSELVPKTKKVEKKIPTKSHFGLEFEKNSNKAFFFERIYYDTFVEEKVEMEKVETCKPAVYVYGEKDEMVEKTIFDSEINIERTIQHNFFWLCNFSINHLDSDYKFVKFKIEMNNF